VQGLKYKWIGVQEPRLMMGYKILIKTALGLDLVRHETSKKNISAQ
jgi:hypothetical protein